AYAPAGLIKGVTQHPMLTGVKLWAFAHLLANGDLGSAILFGTFLAWAIYDRIAVKRREGGTVRVRTGWGLGDWIAVGVGILAWVAFVGGLHRWLFGVGVFA
ncbi:MAG: NnrU family protein, partial [Elioraea sp.]|nr:NnrU family protein [Elioraea sp.]